MQFGYDGQPPLFVEFNLNISPGSRCLLVGANGSGKTTLLRILAGKHMVGGRHIVRVLNHSAFHDTQLGEVPLRGDFSAEHMIFGVEGIDPSRRQKLIELLDIDLQWRMHKVLLLDEVTVDLYVVARMDLLDFFKEECEQREATIVYATHIFYGLETWATHLAFIHDGELRRSEKLSEVEELKSSANLLSVVESWLRSETKQGKRKPITASSLNQKTTPFGSSPFTSSRHMVYYR